jgi:8-amino-7-oxononanoate synthase
MQAVAHKGAVMVGPPMLRQYLINYARPLIYSTALPLTSLLAIRASLRLVFAADDARKTIRGELQPQNQFISITYIVNSLAYGADA